MAPTRRTGRYASTGAMPVASSLPWSTPRAARARSTRPAPGHSRARTGAARPVPPVAGDLPASPRPDLLLAHQAVRTLPAGEVAPASPGEPIAENLQPVGELGIVGRGHMGLEDDRLEFEVLLHAPEDHVELAHDELEQVDLGLEELKDPFLDGSPGHEVDEQDIARLADTVDPA